MHAATLGDQSLLRRHLAVLGGVELLQQEEGVSGEEVMGRLLGGDGGDAVVVFVVETAQHVEHLAHLMHRLANITETIGELLEALGVLESLGLIWHDVVY